jgi:hypothetical protein
MGQWVDKNEEQPRIATEFNSSNGKIQYNTYEREFSVSDDDRQDDESDYAVDYMTDPRLTDHIIVDFLTHMDTAQKDTLKAEQA